MNIEKALNLKVGDLVHCPADRGSPPFSAKVISPILPVVEVIESTGVQYVSVNLGNKGCWPSNRLG